MIPKRFIQIIGAPKSGKSTIALNIRHACDALWNDSLATTSQGIRFIGSGLNYNEWNRLVGSDAFELEFDNLDKGTKEFYKEIYRSAQMPMTKHILVEGTFGKHIDYDLIKKLGFEVHIFVPMVDKEVIKKIGNKDFDHYKQFQERILEKIAPAILTGHSLTIFDSSAPLEERVKIVADLLGVQLKEIIYNFKDYWAQHHS